jgi:hypothetical protein
LTRVATEPLACPSCASTYTLDERFCRKCGTPLVYTGTKVAGDVPVTETHARARKIKPQYAEGREIRIAGGRNQAEAEFIQALLLEEGIPSILRRARGFDVPDFLAAGPRDVLVPASGVEAARDVLLQADVPLAADAAGPDPRRVLAGLLGGVAVVGLVVWAISQVS